MDTPKETILAVIRSMPDDATWEQIRYRVDLVTGIELGMEDVAAGRLIPHEQVMREMSQWLESHGRNAPEPKPMSSLAGSASTTG